MTFSVSDFTGIIANKGLASPNKFQVQISFPAAGIDQELSLMCESASIGGRTVQSMLDIQYGIRREIAYGAPQYTPLSLSFLCTEKLEEKIKLENWNNMIVDSRSSVAGGKFDVEYYSKYAGQIIVKKLNKSNEEVFAIKYLDAWPKTVSQVDLNHSTTNATLRVTCEFSYSYWEMEGSGVANPSTTSTSITHTNPHTR
jgi:hypothetical protein